MKRRKLQALGVVLVLMAGAAMVAAQGRRNITVKGSDTLVILGQRWAEEFMKKNPGSSVQVTGGGSGVGIAALINGTTDIAESSRPMKDAEKASVKEKRGKETLELPVAVDGLAVYVHEQNPVAELSLPQLKAIYTGAVKNWSQVGGRDEKILLYSRENSSGTYAYFKEHVLENADYYPTAQTLPGTAAVINAVARDTRGIGYGGIAYGKGIKHLRVRKDEKSPAVEPSMENVLQGKYPISRFLYWYLAGQPAGDIQKLAQWVVSKEGQEVVEKVGYYPLNEKDRVASAAKLGGSVAASKSKPSGSK
jgi:phosphate transport system substrate-binding protein